MGGKNVFLKIQTCFTQIQNHVDLKKDDYIT